MNNALRTVKTFKEFILDRIEDSQYQKKGTTTAILKQEVVTTSYYQGVKTHSSLSDNIFSNEDFGEITDEQPYDSTSTRVAFVLVPKGTTEAQFKAQLAKVVAEKGADNVKIYRILSSRPIKSAEQSTAIKNGLTTEDAIANSQAVRYPEGATDKDGNDISGQLALDINGKVQFRATFLTTSGEEDKDYRTEDLNDTYLTPELEEELAMGTTVNFQAESPESQAQLQTMQQA